MKLRSKIVFLVVLSALLLVTFSALSGVVLPIDQAQRVVKLKKLAEKFDSNKSFYMSHKYHEQNVRDDFIDKFFEILGWDVTNRGQVLLYAQDSVLEARLKILQTTKFVDYSFRIDGRNVFFVEAKAASKDIDDPDFIFQAKRYAWSSGNVDIVILTDYETFRVYDARLKPDYYAPKTGEIKQFRMSYKDYAKNFQLLWSAFSKSAVANGSLKKVHSNPDKQKRGKIPMEMDFINDFNKLRLILATDIWKNNPDIKEKELNEATQDILNKLIFARVLEDRDITPTKRLAFAVISFYHDTSILLGDKGHYLTKENLKPAQPTLFKEIQQEFNELAKRYNGVIFGKRNFYNLKISDEVLKEIIENLYFPKSPYDFAVMPNDVIGKTHETYLGKRISIQNNELIIADRTEVKSSGGVFYTPKPVAEFMVNQTLGDKLKNQDITILNKIKILDPACGSGVFPAATAAKLFEFAENYYNKHPDKVGGTPEFPDAVKYSDGKFYLSAKKRAEIIENAIFCTDIDAQAVDNTIIWLYMAILEKSNSTIVQKERQYKIPYKSPLTPKNAEFFKLPDLKKNIVVANALVGSDYGSADENADVKAFDWTSGKIGEVVNNGGFDVIIGNPPYISTQRMSVSLGGQYNYIKKKYKTMSGQSDLYFAFFEKMLPFMNKKGTLAFITSNRFLYNADANGFRNFLYKTGSIRQIIDFNLKPIFPGVGVQAALTMMQPAQSKFEYVHISDPKAELQNIEKGIEKGFYTRRLPVSELSKKIWLFPQEKTRVLLDKIKTTAKMGDIMTIFSGTSTGQDKILMVEPTAIDDETVVFNKNGQEFRVEKEFMRNFAKGKNIQRFKTIQTDNMIVFPYIIQDGTPKLLSESELKGRAPRLFSYLMKYKSELEKRRTSKKWYELAALRNYKLQSQPKLITGFAKGRQPITFEQSGDVQFVGGTCKGIVSKNPAYSNEMLLGILNSSLINEFINSQIPAFIGGAKYYSETVLESIPLIPINQHTAQIYKMIEQKVKLIYVLQQRTEYDFVKAQISILENDIDMLVNDLYGINTNVIPKNDNRDSISTAA